MNIVEYMNMLAEEYFKVHKEDEQIGKYQCNDCIASFNDKTSASMHYWKEHDEYVSDDDISLKFTDKELEA